MGDRRKLNGEIERCLKKVTEGVEIFEDVWQKVHSAPNHNQKDRYEQDLKKEIKKLQRLRDQIKTWMSSPDVKNKTALQEARKTIEQQMERFKIVEREMKTKAYSKEGLGAGQKLDPQEKEKEECSQWIKEAIQKLELQVDKFESDIESLSVALKKKKSDSEKQDRLKETKRSMERHKYHIESLQKILRAVHNDAVDLKPIHNLRGDIEYYIDSNQETDFEENDMMYEDIDMENLNTIMAPVITAPIQSHPSSLPNGTASGLNLTMSTLMDLSVPLSSNIHSSIHNPIERMMTTMTTMSSLSHGDNESVPGLTTPSSTQPSSPSAASPALTSSDDGKTKTKFESDENYSSQRNRSNSGANGSSTTTLSYLTSPKTAPTAGVYSSAKGSILSSSSAATSHSSSPSTSVSTTTTTTTTTTAPTIAPILPYSAIVSQNALSSTSTTTTSSNSTSKQQQQQQQQLNVFSPPSKQTARQLSVNTNEATVTSNLTLPISPVTTTVTSSSSNSSQPSSLLTAHHERTGISLNLSSSTATAASNAGVANGPTLSSSLFSGSSSTLSNSNIPLEFSSTSNSLDSTSNSQPSSSSLLTRTMSETDRSSNPTTSSSASLISNGLTDSGHTRLDNNSFANVLPASNNTLTAASTTSTNSVSTSSISSVFLPTTNLSDLPSTNGGTIGQSIDHHSLRYSSIPLSNQQSIPNNRVPLTNAEIRMLNRLNSAYSKLPSLLESERQRSNANRICGRNPLSPSQAIPYYPQIPPTGSDSAEFYYRLAPDTLFFVFYYMEGTRAQYLAAKALKRQSWRFHTKHMMWFQRHEEPKTITDDYEQGTYIFFDYERWQTRKRDNFMFEYKFLEDREF